MRMEWDAVYECADVDVGGQGVRLAVAGWPSGTAAWDTARRRLLEEPWGHAGLLGGVVEAPRNSHAITVRAMDHTGFPLCHLEVVAALGIWRYAVGGPAATDVEIGGDTVPVTVEPISNAGAVHVAVGPIHWRLLEMPGPARDQARPIWVRDGTRDGVLWLGQPRNADESWIRSPLDEPVAIARAALRAATAGRTWVRAAVWGTSEDEARWTQVVVPARGGPLRSPGWTALVLRLLAALAQESLADAGALAVEGPSGIPTQMSWRREPDGLAASLVTTGSLLGFRRFYAQPHDSLVPFLIE